MNIDKILKNPALENEFLRIAGITAEDIKEAEATAEADLEKLEQEHIKKYGYRLSDELTKHRSLNYVK